MSPSGFVVFFSFLLYRHLTIPFHRIPCSRTQWCWMLIPFRYFADGSGSLWMMGCRGSAPVSMGWHWNEPCGSRRWDGLEIPIEMGISSSLCRAGSTSGLQRTPGWWQGAERTGLCVAAGGASLSVCYLVRKMGIGSMVSWWTECILPLLLLDADLASSWPRDEVTRLHPGGSHHRWRLWLSAIWGQCHCFQ